MNDIIEGHCWRVICEWDIGLEDTVYETYDLAYSGAEKALTDTDISDNIDDLESEGLIIFREVTFIMEK